MRVVTCNHRQETRPAEPGLVLYAVHMALTRAENAVAEHLMRPLCPLLQFAAAVEAQVSGQPLWFCHDTHLVALRKSKFVQGESEPLKPVRSRFDGLEPPLR